MKIRHSTLQRYSIYLNPGHQRIKTVRLCPRNSVLSFCQGQDTLFPFTVLLEGVRYLRQGVAVNEVLPKSCLSPTLLCEGHQLLVRPGRQGLDSTEPVWQLDGATWEGDNVIVIVNIHVGGDKSCADLNLAANMIENVSIILVFRSAKVTQIYQADPDVIDFEAQVIVRLLSHAVLAQEGFAFASKSNQGLFGRDKFLLRRVELVEKFKLAARQIILFRQGPR